LQKSFPAHPDELTSDWLSEVLGYPVEQFEVTFFSEGAGVMAWVTRLLLTTGPGKPDAIIAKFPSPAQQNRDVAQVYNMYGRELQFYRDIAPHLSLRVPHCYYAAFDTSDQDFILLLEDLGEMRIGDQVAGCTLEQAKRVIAGIARMHAGAWQSAELGDLVSHNNPAQIAGMQAGYPVGWPVVLAQFGDLIPSEVRPLAEQMPQVIAPLLEQMCRPPVCLTHADMRLDNIFFGADDVAFVDWQSVCTSAPEQDVAYFITQSLSAKVRSDTDLVAYYHQQLVAAGIDYDLDDCRARFRVSALYLLCYAVVIAGTLDLANDRGQALGRTLIGNAFQSLQDLDAFRLLRDLLAQTES